jgi:hypothetical protein
MKRLGEESDGVWQIGSIQSFGGMMMRIQTSGLAGMQALERTEDFFLIYDHNN